MLCYYLWHVRDFCTDICVKMNVAVILEISVPIMCLFCDH